MFEKVGETLRRVRKESGRTLEQLGEDAGLGRGQLSRIENGRQEATFKTLSKILQTHGMSRREFFRRLDLVEAEALAVENPSGTGGQELYDLSGSQWPGEIRDMLSRVVSTDPRVLQARSIAQGAVEVGEVVVLFRVVPRGLPASPGASPPTPGPSSSEAPPDHASRHPAPQVSPGEPPPMPSGASPASSSPGSALSSSSSSAGRPVASPPGARPFRRGPRQRG